MNKTDDPNYYRDYKRKWRKLPHAQAAARAYRQSHKTEMAAYLRSWKWPWRKAHDAAKTASSRAREYGVQDDRPDKTVFARLHLLPCNYCGVVPALTVDHVTPMFLGGTNTLDNIVPSCLPCNLARPRSAA